MHPQERMCKRFEEFEEYVFNLLSSLLSENEEEANKQLFLFRYE